MPPGNAKRRTIHSRGGGIRIDTAARWPRYRTGVICPLSNVKTVVGASSSSPCFVNA